jgi:hypothetical protein
MVTHERKKEKEYFVTDDGGQKLRSVGEIKVKKET